MKPRLNHLNIRFSYLFRILALSGVEWVGFPIGRSPIGILQNEPNFQKTKKDVCPSLKTTYEKIPLFRRQKNEPNRTQCYVKIGKINARYVSTKPYKNSSRAQPRDHQKTDKNLSRAQSRDLKKCQKSTQACFSIRNPNNIAGKRGQKVLKNGQFLAISVQNREIFVNFWLFLRIFKRFFLTHPA